MRVGELSPQERQQPSLDLQGAATPADRGACQSVTTSRDANSPCLSRCLRQPSNNTQWPTGARSDDPGPAQSRTSGWNSRMAVRTQAEKSNVSSTCSCVV